MLALSKVVGLSKSYICELEHGTSTKPSAQVVSKIASYFGVTIESLVNEACDPMKSEEVDQAFIEKYLSIDETLKARARKILDILIETHKKVPNN